MDIQTPSPQTTLAILLGASEWPESPDFPGSKAFAHAISSFRRYLFDPRGFGLPKENALDIFDDSSAPHVLDRKIRQFLDGKMAEMNLAGNVAKDLLLYFVGHGGFVGRNSDYYLAVRCTSTEDARLSGIPMESLASTLTDKARYLRRIIILDCCYAAAAFTSFQAEGPAKLGIDQTFHAFEKKAKTVGKGTTLLCSSGKTVASQIAQDQSCTLFSKALLQVLLTGDERRQEQHYFSLREVADLTEEVITRDFDEKAPRPEIHSPDQKEGDVALIPFFPNPAAVEAEERARLEEERVKAEEELARKQARQREELAREQAKQQEELAAQRVRRQRELASWQWELAQERLHQRSGRKASSVKGAALRVVGIDLGTTNSCIAVLVTGQPVVIPNAEGSRTTPSVVALNSKGEWLVGEAAKQQAITNPENTIFSIKRFIGRKYDDPEVVRDRHLVPYKIVPASNGDAWVEIQGKQYSPIEISARILQKLKADAERHIGQRIMQVIITVPSYFTDKQRQATKDAGKIAGLEALRNINEPTAASLAYGLGKKKDERIAVYDMGGGTFNISVLELGDGVFEVRSTNGDTHLGGEDFTQRVIGWLTDEFRKEYGIDLRQDRLALQRLKEAAEKAKKELSSSMQTEINLPYITADASGPKHLAMMLSRSKLEQLVEDLVEKSRGHVMKALSDAWVRPGDINEVVLVGGQTRMPAVQALVQRIFAREPHRGVSQDEVVAAGAAVQAGVLTGEVKDVLLLDVTPRSLGVETLGGISTRIIERNTTIPTEKAQVFTVRGDSNLGCLFQEEDSPSPNPDDKSKKTSKDAPTRYNIPPSVEINILQGEREFAKDNRSLGSFILDGLQPSQPPQIEITFDIDQNDILRVRARDKATGREKKITISPSSGLTRDQIDRMTHDAELNVLEDKLRKEFSEERDAAESICSLAEKTIAELDDMLTLEQKNLLAFRIEKVRSTLATDQIDDVKSSREGLEQVFHEISENIYNQLYSSGASGAS